MLDYEQAQAGLEHLRKLRDRNNYWGAMWVPEIERRQVCGEELEDLIEYALGNAARWLTQASREKSPIGPGSDLRLSLLALFEATGQDQARYGYVTSR